MESNLFRILRLGLPVFLCVWLTACGSSQLPPSELAEAHASANTSHKKMNAEDIRQYKASMKKEEAKNIGEPLPDNIIVIDSQGNKVSLRSVLHGPAVVVKTVSGCSPCNRLDGYISQHGDDYADSQGAQLVVLYTGSPADPDANNYPGDLPPQVVILRHPGFMFGGFLGGSNVPAAYFFDKNLVLIRTREGIASTAQAMLQYPKTSKD